MRRRPKRCTPLFSGVCGNLRLPARARAGDRETQAVPGYGPPVQSSLALWLILAPASERAPTELGWDAPAECPDETTVRAAVEELLGAPLTRVRPRRMTAIAAVVDPSDGRSPWLGFTLAPALTYVLRPWVALWLTPELVVPAIRTAFRVPRAARAAMARAVIPVELTVSTPPVVPSVLELLVLELPVVVPPEVLSGPPVLGSPLVIPGESFEDASLAFPVSVLSDAWVGSPRSTLVVQPIAVDRHRMGREKRAHDHAEGSL